MGSRSDSALRTAGAAGFRGRSVFPSAGRRLRPADHRRHDQDPAAGPSRLAPTRLDATFGRAGRPPAASCLALRSGGALARQPAERLQHAPGDLVDRAFGPIPSRRLHASIPPIRRSPLPEREAPRQGSCCGKASQRQIAPKPGKPSTLVLSLQLREYEADCTRPSRLARRRLRLWSAALSSGRIAPSPARTSPALGLRVASCVAAVRRTAPGGFAGCRRRAVLRSWLFRFPFRRSC